MPSLDYENVNSNPDPKSFHYQYSNKYVNEAEGEDLRKLWNDYLSINFKDKHSKVDAFNNVLMHVYIESKEARKSSIYSKEVDSIIKEVYPRLDSYFEELFSKRKIAKDLQVIFHMWSISTILNKLYLLFSE